MKQDSYLNLRQFMENQSEHMLENLLDQIHQTLKIIQNREDPISLSPELLADVRRLESTVAQLKEGHDELLNLLDVDIERLQKEMLTSSDASTNTKQLTQRAKDIEQEARVMQLALTAKRGKERKKGQKTTQQEEDKQQMKERRKLFKTIGGDKKWIPL